MAYWKTTGQVKYVELDSFIKNNTDMDLGYLTLVKDCKIYLYTGIPIKSKKGNLIISMIVIECGGAPAIFFKT